MRNAILLADQAAGGANRTPHLVGLRRPAAWATSRRPTTPTTPPLEDFSLPPAPGDPRGRIAGTLRDVAHRRAGRGRDGGDRRARRRDRTRSPRPAAATAASRSRACPRGRIRAWSSRRPATTRSSRPVTVSARSDGARRARRWSATGRRRSPARRSPRARQRRVRRPGLRARRGGRPVAGHGLVDRCERRRQVDGPDAAAGGRRLATSRSIPARRAATTRARRRATTAIETSTGSAAGPWVEVASGAFADADRHELNAVRRHGRRRRPPRPGHAAERAGRRRLLRPLRVRRPRHGQRPPPPTPTPTAGADDADAHADPGRAARGADLLAAGERQDDREVQRHVRRWPAP